MHSIPVGNARGESRFSPKDKGRGWVTMACGWVMLVLGGLRGRVTLVPLQNFCLRRDSKCKMALDLMLDFEDISKICIFSVIIVLLHLGL